MQDEAKERRRKKRQRFLQAAHKGNLESGEVSKFYFCFLFSNFPVIAHNVGGKRMGDRGDGEMSRK